MTLSIKQNDVQETLGAEMDDDGGIQYWQQLGQHELQEYEAWLDEVDKRLNELDKRFNSELSNEEESK
jgi:hypothetical protein